MRQIIYNALTGETEVIELPDEPIYEDEGGIPAPTPTPSDSDRFAALEAAIADLRQQLDQQGTDK